MISFIKYFLISAIALVFDYALYMIFMMELPVVVSGSLSYILAAAAHYALSRQFVFVSRSAWLHGRPTAEFLLYVLSALLGTALTAATLWTTVDTLHLDPRLGKLIAVGISFVSLYFFRKLVVFREKANLHSLEQL